LKRCYPLWRKYVVFLDGRYLVVSIGYRCPHLKCVGHKRVYASQAARHLTVRGSSFALEMIVQIGYWRFWKRWTVTQIHEVLTRERHLPISEREVLYLIGVFLVLLRCTYHLRWEEHATYFRRQGVFLSIDALKPEKGNTALYVARELKFGLVLQVTPVLSADHRTLERRVLQPVKALGYRIRGVVSDDERALLLAVAHVFPGVRHQTCQVLYPCWLEVVGGRDRVRLPCHVAVDGRHQHDPGAVHPACPHLEKSTAGGTMEWTVVQHFAARRV
jgi:hypothetical protein